MTLLLYTPIVSNLNPSLSYYTSPLFPFPIVLGAHPPCRHASWDESSPQAQERNLKPILVISFCLPVLIWTLAGVTILGSENEEKSTERQQLKSFSFTTKILAEELLLFSASSGCQRSSDARGC